MGVSFSQVLYSLGITPNRTLNNEQKQKIRRADVLTSSRKVGEASEHTVQYAGRV